MADKKISELPSASALTGTEIVPLVQGGTTDKTTTQDIADLAINSVDLQAVTDNGNITVDALIVEDGDYSSSVKKEYIESKNIITNQSATLQSNAKLKLQNNFVTGLLGITNLTNSIQLEFPDKTAGNYTIATTDDVSGLVPYTGATSDVDLGTHILNAQSVNVKGTGGNGHLGLKHQSTDATATGSETVIFAGSDGEPRYKNDGGAVAQFASRAWVTAQGYITNVITALGYTPVPTTRTINGYDLSANRTLTASDVSAVASNGAITGATKTKITYDSKGLVTSGADATTADIADSTNKRYVTDAQLTVIGNTSNTNTGDETQATIVSKLGYTPYDSTNPSGYITSSALSPYLTSVTAATTYQTILPAASALANGYLTSTDWSTFNGKLSATITSVLGGDILEYNSTTSTWVNSHPYWTVELIQLSTIDFYTTRNVIIDSITNIVGSPTITILDDGVTYTLGNTIAANSKITVSTNIQSVVKLNIRY